MQRATQLKRTSGQATSKSGEFTFSIRIELFRFLNAEGFDTILDAGIAHGDP